MKELSDDDIKKQFGIPDVCNCWRRPWHTRNKKCDATPWMIEKKFTRVRRDCQICFNGYAEVPHLAKRRWGGSVYDYDIQPVCNNCHKRFDRPWFIRMFQDGRGNFTYSRIFGLLGPVVKRLFS